MKKQPIVISRGPFKGKKIEFASTSGVDALTEISEEFMKKIFDLHPGTYLISDESCLHDFVGIDERDLTNIYAKVRTEYGLDVSRLRLGNLLALFKNIRRMKARGVKSRGNKSASPHRETKNSKEEVI